MRNPKPRTRNFTVEIWKDGLRVIVEARTLADASQIVDALSRSPSVSGLNVFDRAGKFLGARDGGD